MKLHEIKDCAQECRECGFPAEYQLDIECEDGDVFDIYLCKAQMRELWELANRVAEKEGFRYEGSRPQEGRSRGDGKAPRPRKPSVVRRDRRNHRGRR